MHVGGPVILQGVADLPLRGPGPLHRAVIAEVHEQVEGGWGEVFG